MLCTGPSVTASCLSPSWWPVSEHLSGVLWAPNSVFCSLHVLETKAPGLMNLQASISMRDKERKKKTNHDILLHGVGGWESLKYHEPQLSLIYRNSECSFANSLSVTPSPPLNRCNNPLWESGKVEFIPHPPHLVALPISVLLGSKGLEAQVHSRKSPVCLSM